MYNFSLENIDAPIQGIYLSSEMIDLLSVIQCADIEQLKEFVRECSQLSIDEDEIKSWDSNKFESIKKEVFDKYKESFISTKQSTTDRKSVFQKTLLNAGLSQRDAQRYYEVFMNLGIDGIKSLLGQEHLDEYAEISEKQHEFIASERDQIKSVSYREMQEISNMLPKSNTILIGSGRYYDVTNKLYNPNIDMKKYDFYHIKKGLNFCKINGKNARYHTLLDKQTMEDVMRGKSKDEILTELKAYVKESVDFINQYNIENKLPNGKSVITSVDLFNEIISFDKPYRNMWQKLHGISLKDLAEVFQYANEHKPEGVTYVYNEPFLENDDRRKVVIDTLKQINALSPGLVDTLGSQMHIEMTQNLDEIRREFQDFKVLQDRGYNIQITEFDMCIPERRMFDKDGKLQTRIINRTNIRI